MIVKDNVLKPAHHVRQSRLHSPRQLIRGLGDGVDLLTSLSRIHLLSVVVRVDEVDDLGTRSTPRLGYQGVEDHLPGQRAIPVGRS